MQVESQSSFPLWDLTLAEELEKDDRLEFQIQIFYFIQAKIKVGFLVNKICCNNHK